MNDMTINQRMIKIKKMIESLINEGKLEEATKSICEYEKIVNDDIDTYSMKAVIFIMKKKLDDAEIILKQGLAFDDENFDLNYNLGFVYEQQKKFSEAVRYYKEAEENCDDGKIGKNVQNVVKNIEEKFSDYNKKLQNDSYKSQINDISKYFGKNIDKVVLKYFKDRDFNKVIQYIQCKINFSEYDEVIKVCDYWLKNINSNTAIIYYFMGVSANAIKDFRNALIYHTKALELDNTLADLRNRKSKYQYNYKEKNINCIGCGSKDFEIVNVTNQSISEDNKQLINPIRVWVKCKKCGLIYANPIPTEEALDNYYSKIAKEKFGGMYGNIDNRFEFLVNLANHRLEKIEKYESQQKTLLDIGTGVGIFTGVALDRGWSVEGLELTPEDCKYAKEKYDLNLKQENFYSFKEDKKYDVVTLFEVIEHLKNPLKDLKQINKLVKNNGMLVLATPIQNSLYGKRMKEKNVFWNVVAHLSYFTKNVMLNFLKEAGFKVLEINNSNEGMGRMEFYCRKI